MMRRSQHQIIVELYLLYTGGYYARLICSVTPVVQGSYPDDGHIWPKHVVLILTLKNIHLLYIRRVMFWTTLTRS